jgi:hypothetical protein
MESKRLASWTHVRGDWRRVSDVLLFGGEASAWLLGALRSALHRDAYDVANDVELLVAILTGRCEDPEDEASEFDLHAIGGEGRTATRRCFLPRARRRAARRPLARAAAGGR